MLNWFAKLIYRSKVRAHLYATQPPLPIGIDAVILLDGGRYIRLPAAIQASARTGAGMVQTRDLQPRPQTTEDEAERCAEKALHEGWRGVALVTQRFHMARALWLFRRAMPGVQVVPYYADAKGEGEEQVNNEARKWLGHRLGIS